MKISLIFIFTFGKENHILHKHYLSQKNFIQTLEIKFKLLLRKFIFKQSRENPKFPTFF